MTTYINLIQLHKFDSMSYTQQHVAPSIIFSYIVLLHLPNHTLTYTVKYVNFVSHYQ